MAVFITTFRNLLKLKSTVIFIIIMSILPVVISFIIKSQLYSGKMSFESQLDFTVGIYYILIFMWVLGIPFLIMISAKGIGLIANELSEGTLGLLVSMKISRYQIVLYKWLALYIVTLLLGILGIFSNLSIMFTISNMDINIQQQLIKSIPYLLEYLLVVGFIFSGISIFMSLIIKSKIFATISLTFYIVIIFLIIPLFKNFLNSYYVKYQLYYFDINYQFSLIYFYFISKSHVIITPTLQTIMGTFVGVFNMKKITDEDMSVLLNTPLMKNAPIYTYFDAYHIILFWLLVGLLSIILSIFILAKRDIT